MSVAAVRPGTKAFDKKDFNNVVEKYQSYHMISWTFISLQCLGGHENRIDIQRLTVPMNGAPLSTSIFVLQASSASEGTCDHTH